MTDNMKFGPEWLRNMSADVGLASTTNSTPRYPLAEFRYGREEMLSLFEKNNIKIPDILPRFKKLYVEKVQCPLALTPSTEDDMRVWPRSTGVPVGVSVRGARGGSVDRGRGRGRGTFHTGGIGGGYARSTSLYDDDGRGGGIGLGGRGWPERNGTSGSPIAGGSGGGSGISGDPASEWNNSSATSTLLSPRKEYVVHGRANSNENWRRLRNDDDGGISDGWRSSVSRSTSGSGGEKWARSNSWRDDDPLTPSSGGVGGNGGESPQSRAGDTYVGGGKGLVAKGGYITSNNDDSDQTLLLKSHSTYDDDLPEWATEDPHDGGGSFDSSGAFHGSDDENEHGHHPQHILREKLKCNSKDSTVLGCDGVGVIIKNNDANNGKPTLISSSAAPTETKSAMEKHLIDGGDSKIKDVDKESKNIQNIESSSAEIVEGVVVTQRDSTNRGDHVDDKRLIQARTRIGSGGGGPHNQPNSMPLISSVDRMQEVADDMVEKLIMDDEINNHHHPNQQQQQVITGVHDVVSGTVVLPTLPTIPQQSRNLSVTSGGVAVQNIEDPMATSMNGPINVVPKHLQTMPMPAAGVVTTKSPPKSLHQPGNENMWYYHDPQGNVQGPFTASEMTEWNRAGYFDENLYVRRQCDTRYSTLGELIERLDGQSPFLASHLLPPMFKPSSLSTHSPITTPIASIHELHMSVLANRIPPTVVGQPQHQPQQQQSSSVAKNSMEINFMLQKQLYLRQQSMIIQKLSAIEPWAMLSSEQQNSLVNQHMAQSAHFLMGGGVEPNSGSQMNKMGPPTNVQPILKQNFDFIQAGSAGSDGLPESVDTIQQFLLSTQQQTAPQLVQQTQSQSQNHGMVDNDPIKSLIMQLSMQKGISQQPQQVTEMLPLWSNQQQQQQKQQQPPQLGSILHQPSNNQRIGTTTATDVNSTKISSWHPSHFWKRTDPSVAPVTSTVNKIDSSGGDGTLLMKTETQIIEEQLQKPQPPQLGSILHQPPHNQHGAGITTTTDVNSTTLTPWHTLNFCWKRTDQSSDSVVTNTAKKVESNVLLKTENQITEEHLQMNKKYKDDHIMKQHSKDKQEKIKNDNNKRNSEPSHRANAAPTSLSNNNGGSNNKKDVGKSKESKNIGIAVSQPTKDDFIPVTGKSKKSKTSQQQQLSTSGTVNFNQQDDEKSSGKKILPSVVDKAEEKRNKEIERQRRATIQSTQNVVNSSTTAPVAPWSSTGLSGLSGPSPSLADIQKAEMERRAEQFRVEQSQREQREQQSLLEMQQRENILIWNGRNNILPKNIKSLAEIQAEEHANQQQAQLERDSMMVHQMANSHHHNQLNVSGIVSCGSVGGNRSLITGEHHHQSSSHQANVIATKTSNDPKIINQQKLSSIWNNTSQNLNWSASAKVWGSQSSSNLLTSSGFWEEPTKNSPLTQNVTNSKSSINQSAGSTGSGVGVNTSGGIKTLAKSQTMSNIQTKASVAAKQAAANAVTVAQNKLKSNLAPSTNKINSNRNGGSSGGGVSGPTNNSSTVSGNLKKMQQIDDGGHNNNEFMNWCIKALSNINSTVIQHNDGVDVPTFATFLQDIESPYEVKDYIKGYLGESRECSEFAKQFLERRSKYKNQQRAQNAHIDDMCSPAPAINPANNDFQEVKGKGKKIKKNKMMKLDSRILGFSVTAATDRINVGDRDYGDAS